MELDGIVLNEVGLLGKTNITCSHVYIKAETVVSQPQNGALEKDWLTHTGYSWMKAVISIILSAIG